MSKGVSQGETLVCPSGVRRRHSSQPAVLDFLRETRTRRKSKFSKSSVKKLAFLDDSPAQDKKEKNRGSLTTFRSLAHSIIVWFRLYRYHSSQVRTVLRFVATVNLSAFEEEVEDLLFSTSKFKPDKTIRLTSTALETLRKAPHTRTNDDCSQVVASSRIKRELRKFDAMAELPDEVVLRLTSLAWHQEFEPLTVIIREGDYPLYFYLILSGSVMVSVIDKEKMESQNVCILEKGDSFGELAILENDRRRSSVITRERTNVLVLDKEDYKSIFMRGDLHILNDPILRSNPCLESFPMEIFVNNPKEFMCSYFRSGTILVEDSNIFPWIFIVRSGSCRVLLKVKKIAQVAEERRKAELSRKRRRHLNLLKRKENVEQEPHEIVLRRAMERHLNELSNSTASIAGKLLLRELNIDVEESVDSKENGVMREDSKALRLPPIKGAYYSQIGAGSLPASRKNTGVLLPDGPSLFDEEEHEQGKRTLATDLNKDFYYQVPALFVYLAKQRQCLHTQDKEGSQFVTLQHLHPGMTFGLVHHFFEKQPSVKVVSDGCECFVFNKEFYLRHASSKAIAGAGNLLRPFPSPEEVVDVKVSHLSWHSLRRDVMSNTLDSIARRRVDVHAARQNLPPS